MARTLIIFVIVSLSVLACGGSTSAPHGPTTANVAVQQADLPSGMVRCDLTGDIESFLDKEKVADESTYQSTKSEWDDAKKHGATAAYTAFYTDSAAHCTGLNASGSDIGSATYKLVVNFVVQFKDEATAAKGYTNEKIFNFSAAELKSSGQPVVEGTKTGLTSNSITLSQPIGNQLFYIAVWQKLSFMVILAVLNVDPTASKNIASKQNGRIK